MLLGRRHLLLTLQLPGFESRDWQHQKWTLERPLHRSCPNDPARTSVEDQRNKAELGLEGKNRVPTAQGKHGKWQKEIRQRKHREFGNFAKTQRIWFAQVVSSLIQKVKDIAIFATKIPNCFRSWICQFCVCYSQKSRKLVQGKFAVGQGKHRDFKMQFEWGPCLICKIESNCSYACYNKDLSPHSTGNGVRVGYETQMISTQKT